MKNLKKIINFGETEIIEFKEKLNESLFKTISAFANTHGGEIILGVDKKGNIAGIDQSTKFLEDLTNRIVNKLSIYPEIKTMDLKGKRVVIIKVNRSSYPVSYEGRYYERVGNTTREMNLQKLKVFLLNSTTWDSLTNDYLFDEIDTETVERFIHLAVDKKRLATESLKDSPLLALQKLNLIINGKLTNAAIMLFGKDPQKYFINLCVRIGRFKTETTIIDDKWVKGNLFKQFEETISIIRQHISVRYEIKDFQREDIWDYPIPAIREAVLNALIHRDYSNIANFTMIKVYDDHIWFFNPGKLPEGIKIEQLKMPHSSVFRNPLIAKVFYLAGYIEQYGSGTLRMIDWMKETGLPEPEYKEETGGFSVYFYKDIYTEENLRKMGLNERQIKAVMYVKEKGRITNKEYQTLCEVKKRQTSEDLKELEYKEIFERVGLTGKGTYYILKGRQRGIRSNKGAPKGHKDATKTPKRAKK
ncbi:MAG: helix-turn-helix domain-containing protein [Caldisericaceae bacterium]